MTILTLTDANFNIEVLQAKLPALVLFSNKSTSDIESEKGILETFTAYSGFNECSNTLIFGKIEITENPETIRACIEDRTYGYYSLLLRFEHGKETYWLEIIEQTNLIKFFRQNYFK